MGTTLALVIKCNHVLRARQNYVKVKFKVIRISSVHIRIYISESRSRAYTIQLITYMGSHI